MKKRLGLVMGFMTVLLLSASTEAAKYTDLTGTWSGVVSWVGYDPNLPEKFYYVSSQWSFQVQDQDPDTGNFYGLLANFYPLTGNVSTSKVVTMILSESNGAHRIITGKVSGTKMTGTMQHFGPGGIDTGTFTFQKE